MIVVTGIRAVCSVARQCSLGFFAVCYFVDQQNAAGDLAPFAFVAFRPCCCCSGECHSQIDNSASFNAVKVALQFYMYTSSS